ncbi:MAG: hypothetical protein JSR39_02220 [Verrucomicrobia bacterium]|nr:hypothetical protein [Verrucomicrobiota bacterium]
MTNPTININDLITSQQLQSVLAHGAPAKNANGTTDLVKLAASMQQALEQIKGGVDENAEFEAPASDTDLASLLSSLFETDPKLPQAKQAAAAPAAPAAPEAPASSNPSGHTFGFASLEFSMAIVGATITKMTTTVSTTSSEISGMNAAMGKGMEAVYENLQAQAASNLSSQENESGWDKFWGKVGQDLGAIISVALILGGLLTGNFEVSLAVGTLFVLKESGALSGLATVVADVCMKFDPNMSQKTAQAIGDVVADIVGAVACVTAGRIGAAFEDGAAVATGAAKDGAKSVEKLTEDTASDGIEMEDFSSSSSESVVEQSSRTIEEMTTENADIEKPEKKFLATLKEFASQAASAIKKINPFSYTPKFVNEAALGFAQSWTATNTSSDILKTIDFSNPTTQKWVEGVVGGLTVLTDLFVSGGALMGMAGGGTIPKKTFNALLYKGVEATKLLAGIGLATTETVESGLSVYQGALTNQYGKIQSELQTTQYMLDTVSQDNQMNVNFSSQLITQNFSELIALMNAPGSALSAAAESMYQA